MTKVAVVKISSGAHDLRVQVRGNAARGVRGALGRRLWRGSRGNS